MMLKKFISYLEGLPATIFGGLFLVLSLVMPKLGVSLPVDPAWVTVIISGIPLLYLVVSRIIYNPGISKISSALLITIAMIAAICIGDLFAAGEGAFIMAIGINLPFASIPYVNIPHEHQTVFIGFYSTVANFAALIGVTIGKYFIEATEEVSINVLGLEMVNKQYLLLLTSGLMAIAVVLVHRIDRTTPYSDE